MLNDIKKEISELLLNKTFVRNLSLVSVLAIASLWSLSDLRLLALQSQEDKLVKPFSIVNISSPASLKIIVGSK